METIPIPPNLPVAIDRDRLVAICRLCGIRELALFGSVLRDAYVNRWIGIPSGKPSPVMFLV